MCRKNTESENPKPKRTKNGRMMLLSKRSMGNNKKSKFLKEQQTKRLLNSRR